ncbi:MAG: hypothetical protein JJ895_08125 [Balneolaceae bacterium]|nr:hypothetical protein [Balneolaceae bacterium]
MKTPRVLEENQINWYKNDSTRLNYKMLFGSDQEEETPTKPEAVVEEIITASAEELVHQAKRDRDEKWKIKVEKTRTEAFQQGFEEGQKAGYEQAQQEIEEKLGVIQALISQGQNEWKKRQELIDPGLLDLAFELAEAVIGVPVENPEVRKSLELSLGPLLERVDDQSKPILLVAESDFEFIKQLKEDYAPDAFVKIRVSDTCNPGEFHFESTQEVVVKNVKETLQDFRKNIPVPTWKE